MCKNRNNVEVLKGSKYIRRLNYGWEHSSLNQSESRSQSSCDTARYFPGSIMPFSDLLSADSWTTVATEANLSPLQCLNQPWQPLSQTASQGFSPHHCGHMTKALFSEPVLYPACPRLGKPMTVGRAGSLRVGGIFEGLWNLSSCEKKKMMTPHSPFSFWIHLNPSQASVCT